MPSVDLSEFETEYRPSGADDARSTAARSQQQLAHGHSAIIARRAASAQRFRGVIDAERFGDEADAPVHHAVIRARLTRRLNQVMLVTTPTMTRDGHFQPVKRLMRAAWTDRC